MTVASTVEPVQPTIWYRGPSRYCKQPSPVHSVEEIMAVVILLSKPKLRPYKTTTSTPHPAGSHGLHPRSGLQTFVSEFVWAFCENAGLRLGNIKSQKDSLRLRELDCLFRHSKSWAEWVGVEVSGLMLIRVDGLGFRV